MKAVNMKAVLDSLIKKAGPDAEVVIFDDKGKKCHPEFFSMHIAVPLKDDPSKLEAVCVGASLSVGEEIV